MKKTLLLVFSSACLVFNYSCKSNKNNDTPIPSMEESPYYISKIITTNGSNIDTAVIKKVGDDYFIKKTNNTNTNIIWDTVKKSGSIYTVVKYLNERKTHYGHHNMDAANRISHSLLLRSATDTNYVIDVEYNADGQEWRKTTNYINYKNKYHYHYINQNLAYTIFQVEHFVDPSRSKRDSIVYTYSDIPKKMQLYELGHLNGFSSKNLATSRITYNEAGIATTKIEYEYRLDDVGNVVHLKETTYALPGETITNIRISEFEYTLK